MQNKAVPYIMIWHVVNRHV